MGRLLTRRHVSYRATFLIALLAVAFAACGEATQPADTLLISEGEPRPMRLEYMVQGADAIVIGRVVRELEPSAVTHPTYDHDRPTTVTDEFRNFAVEIEESYVPGLEAPATIAVRFQTNPRIAGTTDPLPEAAGVPDFEVGQKVALFLAQVSRWEADGVTREPPEGFERQSYFGFMSSYHGHPTGPFEAGALVWQDERWVHLPSGESATQAELEQAVSEQANVVPAECLAISELGDYRGIETIAEFAAQADVVIKGRMGGEIAARRGDNAVDVVEVLGGEIDSMEISLEGFGFKRPPGFEECDYYMFLTKHIPELFLDEGVPSERPGVYRITGGPQGAFAVFDGVIDQGGFSLPDYEFKGIPEQDFREEILKYVGGPLIPAQSYRGREGFGALLTGTLEVDGRCLYVVDQFGTAWLPIFPPDSAAWVDGGLVQNLGGTPAPDDPALIGDPPRFEPGQTIWLGGGEMSDEKLEGLAFDQEPHHSCDTSNAWLVAPGGPWLPATPESEGG